MSHLTTLKIAESIYDFAKLLGYSPSSLSYLLYKLPTEQKYIEFKIPKKSGGHRLIKSPCLPLKLLQKRLTNILNRCTQEIEKTYLHKEYLLSHGFKEKINFGSTQKQNYLALGIHTNARCHRNKNYVLNLDLAEFFPSFNFGRIRGFFIKNNNFLLSPTVATLIAQIACHENELPQGSPCSPVITNLITHILDIRLNQWAKKHKCFYSRYVDDITLSTNQQSILEKLFYNSGNLNESKVGVEIEQIIQHSGFRINSKKTRLQFRTSRQAVTGLIVNKKVNIKSEYYRYARSMCYALFSCKTFFLPEAREKPAKIKQLEGILNHIYFIKEFSRTAEELINRKNLLENAKNNKQRAKLDGVFELYFKFLYFRYFVALEKPLILCEGKTDIIYLKAAIKQLNQKNIYKFDHDIDFFSNTGCLSKVMRIHEGTSALKNFIEFYRKSTDFKFQGRRHPVIVLLDNDDEAQTVIKLIKGKYSKEGVAYDRLTNFSYGVTSNLYVVLLPLEQNKDNKIEDFFDSSVTELVLDGKTFSPKNNKEFDSLMHYSKHVLATKVIRPQQEDINFSKFEGILKLVSEVIINYNNNYQLLPAQAGSLANAYKAD